MELSLLFSLLAFVPLLVAAQDDDLSRNFTISNGQIYTPGIVIVNAPQPGTPMGGDDLHVSMDVTINGDLPLPPYDDDSPTQIFNITVFLYSYDTGRNFTISNGTATDDNSTLGDIMDQESGSTVKHIDWVWPDCLVGDGEPDDEDSDRGMYNISIRQNFRLNDEDHYTIFDLPILVTNGIDEDDDRPSCDSINNPLLDPEEVDAESANALGIPTAPGDATEIEVKPEHHEQGEGLGKEEGERPPQDGADDDEFGRLSPDARPGDGLGGAGTLRWWTGASWLSVLCIAWTFVL